MQNHLNSAFVAMIIAAAIVSPSARCFGQLGGIKIPTPKIDIPAPRVPSVPDLRRKTSEAGRHINRKAIEAANHIERKSIEAGQHIGRDLRNLDQKRLEYQRYVLMPQASSYHAYLEAQANGRLNALPAPLRQILAPYYRDIDLGRVRYAERINTVHGQAITVGYNIYYPQSISLNNYGDMRWMLHELEHVSQYRAHGGVESFTIKYLANGGLEAIKQRGINVHDNINLERDADNKANRIIEDVWERWQQTQRRTAGNQGRPQPVQPILSHPFLPAQPTRQPLPTQSYPPNQPPPFNAGDTRQASDGELIAGAIISGIAQVAQERQRREREQRMRPPLSGAAQPPRLGINAQQVVGRGALVTSVTPGWPGARAGIEVNDYIVAINGQPVDSAYAIQAVLRQVAASGQRTASIVVENHRLGHLPIQARYVSVGVSW